MQYTPHQGSYFAHRITLEGLGDDALAQSLSTARVDLNPHQVDAALFALASPLSKGALIADEVGLGKTIEASLVIAQRWAERKRRIPSCWRRRARHPSGARRPRNTPEEIMARRGPTFSCPTLQSWRPPRSTAWSQNSKPLALGTHAAASSPLRRAHGICTVACRSPGHIV